jgi:hypothetical protein
LAAAAFFSSSVPKFFSLSAFICGTHQPPDMLVSSMA